jgi:hypothetical protein
MAVARVEQRLAAIFAADVVGYSRLMGADEAGTVADHGHGTPRRRSGHLNGERAFDLIPGCRSLNQR